MSNEFNIITPTDSYSISVPTDVEEDIDGHTASYWLAGDDTLLQISSYLRESGEQPSARQRLDARLKRDSLASAREQHFRIDHCPDVAAASGKDNEGVHWLFVYAVWPNVTVLLSVSHPEKEATAPSWALQALKSITCNPTGAKDTLGTSE